MSLQEENGPSSSGKRPDLISALGVLTFVNTGAFILIYGIGALGMLQVRALPFEQFEQMLNEGVLRYMQPDQVEQLAVIAPIFYYNGLALMLIYLARTVLRLIGAIAMWRGRKAGFHLYAAAQLLGIFAPHVVLPWAFLGVLGPLATVATTAVYGTQLKRLH